MKNSFLALSILSIVFLTGCVSMDRMVRNAPFNGNDFYRDGVNLWPLYYQEGVNRSILFPLIDMDDKGFAVRPFYHKDENKHGILWPLSAFDTQDNEGWVGPLLWQKKMKKFGLLPLFITSGGDFWSLPAIWLSPRKQKYYVLPLFAKERDGLMVGNFIKGKDWFLIFPVYGQGKDWFYFLNFAYSCNQAREEKNYYVFPVAWYQSSPGKQLSGEKDSRA